MNLHFSQSLPPQQNQPTHTTAITASDHRIADYIVALQSNPSSLLRSLGLSVTLKQWTETAKGTETEAIEETIGSPTRIALALLYLALDLHAATATVLADPLHDAASLLLIHTRPAVVYPVLEAGRPHTDDGRGAHVATTTGGHDHARRHVAPFHEDGMSLGEMITGASGQGHLGGIRMILTHARHVRANDHHRLESAMFLQLGVAECARR